MARCPVSAALAALANRPAARIAGPPGGSNRAGLGARVVYRVTESAHAFGGGSVRLDDVGGGRFRGAGQRECLDGGLHCGDAAGAGAKTYVRPVVEKILLHALPKVGHPGSRLNDLSALYVVGITRKRDRGQDRNDGNYDHQLDQCEPELPREPDHARSARCDDRHADLPLLVTAWYVALTSRHRTARHEVSLTEQTVSASCGPRGRVRRAVAAS